MMPPPAPVLLLLSGPAGTGKTTLCERLVAMHPGVQRVVTSTTRAPRPGERDGVDYHFFSEEEFQRRVAGGEFLEWALVHVNRYGTLRASVLGKLDAGIDLVMNVDVQGAAAFRAAAAADPALGARLVTVFLMPPSLDEMRARLRGRGTAPDDIERRMRTAELEVRDWARFDYSFTTGQREEDFRTLEGIWRSEKLRCSRRA